MEVLLAENYGFCFGVKRAVDGVFEQKESGPTITLGPVTHNKQVVAQMEASGIGIAHSLDELAIMLDKTPTATVIIRAHGVPPDVYARLDSMGVNYKDLTCPCVIANQRLAQRAHENKHHVIITGDGEHPEVIGIKGWAGNNTTIISSPQEAAELVLNNAFDDRAYFLLSQTTFSVALFDEIKEILTNAIKNLTIKNTICNDTQKKQQAARSLAGRVDKMIIIGDKSSSNSKKLYELCKGICESSYFIENIADLELNNFSSNDKIGITAGASTPPATIKEAIQRMSDLLGNENYASVEAVENQQEANQEQRFEDLIEESILTLHTGDVVKGKVISIVNGEVYVDLGYKSDGIIQRGQFSDKSDVDPAAELKPGDELEVYILRVNDGDGNVLLSKKRVDSQKGFKEVQEAFKNNEPIVGKVTEVIKGGVNASIKGVRAFIPSSHLSNRQSKRVDARSLIGQELRLLILEADPVKRNVIASRRDLAEQEEYAGKQEFLKSLEVGAWVTGKITSIADFGAFVGLGPIDGLIHISEISWERIKHASEVLTRDQEVTARVVRVDLDNNKLSLSLKNPTDDPWWDITNRFPINSIVTGKVVRLVTFGAFIELAPKLDGLVHISQIAQHHVEKTEDELTVGQQVDVKILSINLSTKKISLSIKEAIGVEYEEEYEDEYEDEYEYEEAGEYLEDDSSSDDMAELDVLDTSVEEAAEAFEDSLKEQEGGDN